MSKLSLKEERDIKKNRRIISKELSKQIIEYYLQPLDHICINGEVEKKIFHTDLEFVYKIKVYDERYKCFFKTTKFFIVDKKYDLLKVGDKVCFTFVNKVFYKNQVLPILSLKNNEKEIYSLQKGLPLYINWVNATTKVSD